MPCDGRIRPIMLSRFISGTPQIQPHQAVFVSANGSAATMRYQVGACLELGGKIRRAAKPVVTILAHDVERICDRRPESPAMLRMKPVLRMQDRGETACQGTSIRDERLENIVIDALEKRLLQPDRLKALLANMLDDSSSAVRDRQAHLKALRTERTRVDGAIQNMFDFIEQGVVTARDADFASRLAAQRSRRADIESEIVLVEQQLSSAERRVTPEAVSRLGEVISQKLRSKDPVLRQGYARRFIAKVVVEPKLITITGPIKSLEMASCSDPDQIAPVVPSSAREWCRLQDSNL